MLSHFGFLFLLFGGQALAFRETDYTYSQQIVPELKFHWKQVSGDEIHLALETKNLGWAAFGIADPASGSMGGSDIVSAEIGNTGSITLKDRYAMGKTYPVEDACNNWNLVASETQNGTVYVEMKRKLDTNDPQDRPFNLGTPDDHDANMAVIFAWGSGFFNYHGKNRIATRINFKQPARPDPFTLIESDANVCCLIH